MTITRLNWRRTTALTAAAVAMASSAAWGQAAPTTAPAPTVAAAPPTPPAVADIQSLVDQKQFGPAVRAANKLLAMRADGPAGYSRFQVTMLKGDALAGQRSVAAARKVFEAAAHATADPHERALATWTAELFHRARGTNYIPHVKGAGAGTNNGGPIDLIDRDSRKVAFGALLDDELSAMAPDLKRANRSGSLPQILPVVQRVERLAELDEIANGSDDRTAAVGGGLVERARTLMATALKGMWTRIADIHAAATQLRSNTAPVGTVGGLPVQQTVSTQQGLSDRDRTELAGMVDTCDKIHEAATVFAPLARNGADKEWGTLINDATRVAGRAADVLNANYNNTSVTNSYPNGGSTGVDPSTGLPYTPGVLGGGGVGIGGTVITGGGYYPYGPTGPGGTYPGNNVYPGRTNRPTPTTPAQPGTGQPARDRRSRAQASQRPVRPARRSRRPASCRPSRPSSGPTTAGRRPSASTPATPTRPTVPSPPRPTPTADTTDAEPLPSGTRPVGDLDGSTQHPSLRRAAHEPAKRVNSAPAPSASVFAPLRAFAAHEDGYPNERAAVQSPVRRGTPRVPPLLTEPQPVPATPPPAPPSSAVVVARPFRPTVITPTYQNAAQLPAVLADLDRLGLPVIAVDDGSTDGTVAILAAWAEHDPHRRTVLTHARNRGKAAALRTAFAHAAAAGLTHAATIDTDGQLLAADVPKLLDKARTRPAALVLGTRDARAVGYPLRSRLGRWASNRLVWVEAGHTVADTQCGLRVYPLAFAAVAGCAAERFGYETEVITRASWAGVPLVQVPVAAVYFPPAERVSHFRPVVDSLRAVAMHARLIGTAANPARQWRAGRLRSPTGAHPPVGRTLPRRFLRWINPVTAWREARQNDAGRARFAAGFAAGIFIGCVPWYGGQTVLSLFVARRFRLPPMSVIGGSNLSGPPIGVALIAVEIAVGHLLLHGGWPAVTAYGSARMLRPLLGEWVVGAVVVGLALAAVAFVAVDLLLRALPDPSPDGG